MAGYVTAASVFVCGKLGFREASSLLYNLLRFHHIFLYFKSSKPFVFGVCLIIIIIIITTVLIKRITLPLRLYALEKKNVRR